MALLKDLTVDELNFELIKENFIKYLQAQDQFRDYNFDASGMQVLLDLLAYNTYYNSFYLNMAINEAFLSTAQKRNSVVNLARSLNYVPRSTSSSVITGIAVFTVAGSPSSITIPAYTTFSGSVDSTSYTFNTTESIVVSSSSGVYSAQLTLKEGRYINQRYTVNVNDADQRFLILNANIDTTTLYVTVRNSVSDSTTRIFTKSDNLVEITSSSQVYFLEEVEDGLYEIFFGDDIVGTALTDGNVVILEYLVSSGAEANDIENLSFTGTITNVTGVVFAEDGPSSNGSDRETINKIKFNAPKSYEAQNRVVTVEDYRALLLRQSNVKSVSVWGGEDNDPPTYATVFVSVIPEIGETLTATEKEILTETVIKPKRVLTVSTKFVDPEYIYITVNAVVKYDVSSTSLSSTNLKAIVIDTIKQYNDDDINEFSKYFRYSKLSRLIDLSERSILNTLLTIQMRKETDIQLSASARYEISFSNPISNITDGRPSTHPYGVGNQITSNEFSYAGFNSCFLEENNGIMRIYRISGQSKIAVSSNVGTVDYATGKIILIDFTPTAFADGGTTLKLTAKPSEFDILPLRNQILKILDDDITVSIVDDREYSLVNR
ncbi:hypothetical protein EB118_05535 [bacterium]|nr:hypothetical protein [bacterium]